MEFRFQKDVGMIIKVACDAREISISDLSEYLERASGDKPNYKSISGLHWYLSCKYLGLPAETYNYGYNKDFHLNIPVKKP